MRAGFALLITLLIGISLCCTACSTDCATLQLTLLAVKKADAIVIQTENHCVVIDCGEKKNGDDVLAYLEENEITYVDTLIITHYDQDHVGGAAKVLKGITVGAVYAPDYLEDSTEVSKFTAALSTAGLTATYLTEEVCFTLDGAEFMITPTTATSFTDNADNNRSLVTSIVYGETSLLLTGDIDVERIDEMLDSEIGHFDFVKIPHHGKEIANLEDLLNATSPSLLAVSTSNGEYEIDDFLASYGVDYKVTCVDGQIQIISDGESVWFEESTAGE